MENNIRECVTNSVEWDTSAQESVFQKYTINIMAKQYVNLYDKLVRRV